MQRICVLLYLFTFSLFSNEGQDIAERVVHHAFTSIAHIDEGKIFLKPEMLTLKQGKIYVKEVTGAEFPISVVFSSEEIPPYMEVGNSPIFNMWKCECGAWNHKWDHPTHCGSCGRCR